jgi:hypothetical protein
MRALRFCSTKYCSVLALPSLTSWSLLSGSLMPNALSMAKAMSRNQAVDAQIVDGVALGLDRVARVSQVPAMMLATVSNVEDIGKS